MACLSEVSSSAFLWAFYSAGVAKMELLFSLLWLMFTAAPWLLIGATLLLIFRSPPARR